MKFLQTLVVLALCGSSLAATTTTTKKTSTKTTSTKTSTKTSTIKISTIKTSTTKTSSIKTSTIKTSTKPTTGVVRPTSVTTVFPEAAGETSAPTAILITGVYDGGLQRFSRNPDVCQGQKETTEADAMFILEPGAHIKNAIISKAQAEGIHCRGECTIENVWWEDVCEDAATFKQASGTSYIIGGGARTADDKIFQFNGRGTVSIKNFYANTFGKVIRSCGDCDGNGGPRNVLIDSVIAEGSGPLCGINVNYGDSCTITNSCSAKNKSCDRYEGVTDHNGSSTKIGSGPDGVSCFVTNFGLC